MEDALNATRAAVEEGIIAGGGSAYIHVTTQLAELIDSLDGDEKIGARIVQKALRGSSVPHRNKRRSGRRCCDQQSKRVQSRCWI